MPRQTVAQLAEDTNSRFESLEATLGDLVAAIQGIAAGSQPATIEEADEPKAAAAPSAGLVEADASEAAVAIAEASGFEYDLRLPRQSTKSKGGSWRYWVEDPKADAAHASVYIGGADDLDLDEVGVRIVPLANGQGRLVQAMTQSGNPKSTKGRYQWENTFRYGEAVIQVFFNLPKAEAKSLPDEVGVILDLS